MSYDVDIDFQRAKLRSRVKEVTDKGCWRTLSKSSKGYGSGFYDGRRVTLHKLSYLLYKGEVGFRWILHTCDVKDCINPDHLYLGTPAQNQRDRYERNPGNVPRGESHGRVKLFASQVDQLRRLYRDQKWTLVELASVFPVSTTQVHRIVRGERWRVN